MAQATETRRLSDLAQLPADAFTALLGDVFEHSPWVARRAWRSESFSSVTRLHHRMLEVVRQAAPDEQLALLRAHPQLAGQEARSGALTQASDGEQLSAGLKSLSADEMTRMGELNAAYLNKHGFPFIVCVRHYTKAGIFHEMQRRAAHDTAHELQEALNQVASITRIRLNAMFPFD